MPSFSIHTLGCKLNFTDSGAIARQFEDRSFTRTEFGEPSDVTIINTCTVTSEAERKCRQLVRRSLRANPGTYIIVTGCYAQLRATELSAIPGVSAVLGNQEKDQIFQLISSFDPPESPIVSVACFDDKTTFIAGYSSPERTRAFLKVQDGCDYSCSFCTIPAARGASRSGTVRRLLQQALEFEEQGYKELVLSGVNIGLFGKDNGSNLEHLIAALDEQTSIPRFRISSIEPNLVSDGLIDLIADSRSFMPHFHMPLQSGSDFILGKMRRRYSASRYEERVRAIRSRIPNSAIGADVIVGFPGETQSYFQQTVDFIHSLCPSYLHVFTYSERPGTVAAEADFTSQVIPRSERKRRNTALQLLSSRCQLAFENKHIGTTQDVLWEGQSDDNDKMFGYTPTYIRVSAPLDSSKIGRVVSEELCRPVSGGELTTTGALQLEQFC